MIIICTSPLMDGLTAEADRETDVWYEKDYIFEGKYAVMIYPKLHWKPAGAVRIDLPSDH